MKNFRFIVLLVSLVLLKSLAYAQPEEFEQANTAYMEGEYEQALNLYLKTAAQYRSANLYYNIGNTYYKLHQIPRSILFYERALKLNPANEDIRYNLAQANKLIADKIDSKPVSKLNIWWKWFKYGNGEKTWGWLSISFMLLAAILFVLYFISHRLFLRRVGFFGGFIVVALSIAAYVLGMDARNYLQTSDAAIITTAKAEVMSAPTADATEMFVLHEGSRVKLLDEQGDWREIEISSGAKGWLKVSAYEEI